MSKRKFFIQVSYPSSNLYDSARVVTLAIRDDASGECVLDVDISANDWVNIQSTLGVEVEGVTSDHPERFGKRLEVDSHRLGHGATEKELEETRQEMLAEGWETATIRKHNFGPAVHVRRWVDDDAT